MIWTRSAKTFFIVGLLMLAGTVITGLRPLLAIGSVLAAWMLAESLLFQITLRLLDSKAFRLERRLPELGQDGVTWAGVGLDCELEFSFDHPLLLGWLRLEDPIPAPLREQPILWQGAMKPGEQFTLRSRLRAREVGRYQLPGVELSAFSPSGLFHGFVFREAPLELRVYPNVFGLRQARPSKKALNRLLQLGRHRFAHKGGAGELLEIREYQPGDPLRRIVWSISARRDKLHVRELEREVPVRTTLFIDGGTAARLGPRGERPLDRMLAVAGRCLRTTLESHDPIGLCLFNGEQHSWLRPSLGRRHLFAGLRALSEFSSQPPRAFFAKLPALIEQVEAHLHRRRPKLFRPELNPEPSGFFPTLRKAERARRGRLRHLTALVLSELRRPLLSCVPIAQDEAKLASLLTDYAIVHELHLELDPEPSRRRLEEEDVSRGAQLSKLIAGAVARAQDNELFVILVDHLGGDPRALLGAVRIARSRNHRVLVVMPGGLASQRDEAAGVQAIVDAARQQDDAALRRLIYETELGAARSGLCLGLRRLAVPVVELAQDSSPGAIAREIERLKLAGATR